MTDTTKDSVTDALPEPDLLFFDDRLQSPMHGYTPTAVMQIIDTLRAENERLRTVLKATQEACDPQINDDAMMQMAADNTMLRLQLAEAQRELIAKESERAGLELERNNAQRQHTMQCAINKADSQRILELTAQPALAQRDAERWRWLRNHARIFRQSPDMSGNHYWMVQTTTTLRGPTLDAAIDAAKGESNGIR